MRRTVILGALAFLVALELVAYADSTATPLTMRLVEWDWCEWWPFESSWCGDWLG